MLLWRRLLICLHFFIGFDLIDAIISCNRQAGNITLPSNECTGSVCLIRRDNPTAPLHFDCGEGAYYSHYPDGCYGRSSLLCVCRTAKCNTLAFATSSTPNANKPVIKCNGTTPNTASSIGTCSGHFCLSHSANPAPFYYCLDDPPTILSFAPFLGLCYRFEYGRNGETVKGAGSICVCDTEYCSDGISSLPAAPEPVMTGNLTTAGIECYTDGNRTGTCRGDVCFIFRNTLTGLMERGCLISQRNAEARRLLYPSYTRDVFIDYYVCNTVQCNRNITTANASILSMPQIGTTAKPTVTDGGTTPDEWWTTPRGWTDGPIDDNSTWHWNNTWNGTDDDWNTTNGSTPKPGKDNMSQQYALPLSFLLLIFTTLIIT